MRPRTVRMNAAPISQRLSAPQAARSAGAEGSSLMSASAAYRELRLRGFGQRAAGNLTAYLRGIRPVESGWTLYEIERLLFIRYLVSRGSSDAHARS